LNQILIRMLLLMIIKIKYNNNQSNKKFNKILFNYVKIIMNLLKMKVKIWIKIQRIFINN